MGGRGASQQGAAQLQPTKSQPQPSPAPPRPAITCTNQEQLLYSIRTQAWPDHIPPLRAPGLGVERLAEGKET
ncbi:hypothetical protein E2C01_088512 [Portunus trituberculatus]|uniref:Uncharacterized protein n=1 Tax=Portunus trituberculatus TaxID=210409 RepID=A0A5B7JGT0_PORTR|nr:hypothetical protein [Portunus trituberculatus]